MFKVAQPSGLCTAVSFGLPVQASLTRWLFATRWVSWSGVAGLTGFWRGKYCLIIGVDGFLGAHLAKRLVSEGANVIGASPRRRTPSSLRLLGIESAIEHITDGDVTEYDAVQSLFADRPIDVCFHLAAVATLPEAAESPLTTFEVNIRGTWNALEAARRCPTIRAVIVASSDKAYGDQGKALPCREDSSALRGLHAYSGSKACVEFIAHTYFFEYRVPVRVTRCANIYGPADLGFSRLIPGTVMRCLLGLPGLIHHGHADTRREYVYVDDAVEAYLKLAETTYSEEVDWSRLEDLPGASALGHCSYNVGGGPDNVKSVREVIDAIRAVVDPGLPDPTVGDRLWAPVLDIYDQQLDSTKTATLTGWRPNVRLIPDGLVRTVGWYRDHETLLLPLARKALAQPGGDR